MQKHFVTFFSPGTFVSEANRQPIDSWDVDEAIKRARTVLQRHGATPYGFQFTTRSRADNELASKVTDRSPIYYLGGKVETLAEVEARNDPKEEILRSNMRNNSYGRVIVNTNSWKFTGGLKDTDIVLDFTPSMTPREQTQRMAEEALYPVYGFIAAIGAKESTRQSALPITVPPLSPYWNRCSRNTKRKLKIL